MASEPVLDIRSLPGTRETLAYQDGGLFPVLALTADRVAVAALRGGAGHIGREGRMETIRSLDGGLTWTPPYLIADSEDDDRNPAFGVSPQGTLVLLYHRQHNYDADGNYQGRTQVADRRPVVKMATRSLDGGLTWEEPYPLSIDALPAGSPYGKIVSLADGTLLASIYNSQAWTDEPSGQSFDSSYLVRSRDDGLTWEDPSLIAHHKNETALIALPGGDLLAVMRDDGVQGLHSTHSQDGGFTWSDPIQITRARQHPADLVLLSNGDILLTYGNRNPPFRIEGRLSRDRGRSWLDCLLTFSGHLYGYTTEESRRTDLGYPSSVVRGNGQGVTMYYYNPSMRLAADSRQAENNPLYSHQDYCAVAVTWKEEELISAVARATSRQ
ncbi:MAG: sialidase family protein [Caldilineaceae bacterium]|nr:sialidase family protein [Caldilineaceae bacterium]